MQPLNILLIEDDPADHLLIDRHLRHSELEVALRWVRNKEELAAALDVPQWDLILSDYKVIGLDFLHTTQTLRGRYGEVPIILISGSIGEELAVELLKSGISDFVLKDSLVRLVPAISRSLNEQAEKLRRKIAEENLAKNEQLMRAVLEGTSDAVFVKDRQGRYLLCNQAAADFVRRPADQVLGRDDTFLFPEQTARSLMAEDRAVMAADRLQTKEEVVATFDGRELTFLTIKGPMRDSDGRVSGVFGMARDISALKQTEKIQQFNLRLLELVHQHTAIEPLVASFVAEIMAFTGLEAVGIRVLDDDGNIPYQAYQGFSRAFFEQENPLSIHVDHCMCSNVIKGATNADLPFYTPGGSFYLNGTSRFLATASHQEKGATRNACNREGYESVALVPFRSGGRILGLVHVADRRENRVPLPLVETLERAVLQLGTAFERSQAQQKLRRSEGLLRAIIDNAGGMVWVKDLHGRFQVMNNHGLTLFRLGKDEVIGRTVDDFCPPDLAAEHTRNDCRVIESGLAMEVEEEVDLSEGRRTFLTMRFPLLDQDDRIHALGAVCTDITRIKKTETLLKQQQEKFRRLSQEYRTLLDSVPDGIVYLSPSLEILWTNIGAQKLLAPDPDACLKGKRCHAAFFNQEQPCSRCPVRMALRSGESEIGRFSPPDRNQEFEIRAMPMLNDSGEVVGIMEILRDMTAHRKLEAQFRQAQKMESIGTLAGGIAHDFNNILSAILGYGEIALEDLADDDPARKSVQTIIEAGLRASRLTKDLLLFSRKQISRKEIVDLNVIVARLEKFIRRVIGEDIQFLTQLTQQPLSVYADHHQIDQVLMNFSTNARDAMPAGGKLTVSTHSKQIDREFIDFHGFGTPGPYALLTFSDSGKGMDKQTADKIFEPFFTTKEMGKGTGLGLAVVYGIIKEHQGYITVYSEPGFGTVFRVYLPLTRQSEAPEEESQQQQKVVGGKETILLAEDEQTVRSLFTRILRQHGYTVIEAVDGEDAVVQFSRNQEKIDLLLLDLIMPKLNGKAALDAIHGLRPGIRGIFISGYAPENIRHKDLFDAHVEVVYKPVSPKELLAVVRRVLDGS